MYAFQLDRPVRRRVGTEHPRPRPLADAVALAVADVVEVRKGLVGAPGQEDLRPGLEEMLEPGPGVAHDRRAARGRLEQPHARRIPGLHHVLAGHVQRVAKPVVERPVLGGRQVDDALHVGGPRDRLRILRSDDDEAAIRATARPRSASGGRGPAGDQRCRCRGNPCRSDGRRVCPRGSTDRDRQSNTAAAPSVPRRSPGAAPASGRR